MRAFEVFLVYKWLIELLSSGGKTFEQISREWDGSTVSNGNPLSRSTFNRYRTAIDDIFSLKITCGQGSSVYRIANPENLKDNSVVKWLLSTISVHATLKDCSSIKDRIILESIPSADDKVEKIAKAMKANEAIRIHYQCYGYRHENEHEIEPYCLKLHSRRWYLVGKNLTVNDVGLYSLDRIHNIEFTGRQFKLPRKFDAELFFKDCYGVIIADGSEAERIVVRVYKSEGDIRRYMDDLPLHHSQKKIRETEEWSDYEFYIRPTIDFLRVLMGYGGELRVIEPVELAEYMQDWCWDAWSLYNLELEK